MPLSDAVKQDVLEMLDMVAAVAATTYCGKWRFCIFPYFHTLLLLLRAAGQDEWQTIYRPWPRMGCLVRTTAL